MKSLSTQTMFPHNYFDCSEGLFAFNVSIRLHYTRLFPDPRFLLFVLQNIAGYKDAVECLL